VSDHPPQDLRRLAQLTGEPLDELQRWIDAGLLGANEADLAAANVVAQVRLVQLLRRRGFDVDAVIQAVRAQPELFARYRDQIAPASGDLHTLDEAARVHGLDRSLVRRIWETSGFGDQGEIGTEEDMRALSAIAVATRAGIPPDALVQLMRVYADAFARVAEAETRLFHFHVHEQLRAAGASGADLIEGTDAALAQLQPLVEPALLYFHRKALARSVSEDIALHLAEDAGLLPPGDPTGQLTLAIAFVDLARFTSMTEAMGDLAAADVLDRFSELTRRAVMRAGGRVVKQIGDEFMLVFPDVSTAVTACLELRDAAERETSFLATRIGLHYGTVVCREGDYVGTTVNVAARLTGEAAAHQLLVSEAIVRGAATLAGVQFTPAGTRALKGIDHAVEVFEGRRRAATDAVRYVDPVCGMSVDPTSSPPTSAHDGRTLLFCSATCKEKFEADPDRYPPRPT